MAFITLGNLTLCYDIRGQGPRVVFIPGTASDLRQQANIFASPLVEHFEVLSFDQRGIGQSDSPDPEPTMLDYASDVKKLLDTLGWQKCSCIGESFGGMVAQEFALNYGKFHSQWSSQKSGGNSAVSPEFVIAGMIFHPSRVQSELLHKYIEQSFVEVTLLPARHREDVGLLTL